MSQLKQAIAILLICLNRYEIWYGNIQCHEKYLELWLIISNDGNSNNSCLINMLFPEFQYVTFFPCNFTSFPGLASASDNLMMILNTTFGLVIQHSNYKQKIDSTLKRQLHPSKHLPVQSKQKRVEICSKLTRNTRNTA